MRWSLVEAKATYFVCLGLLAAKKTVVVLSFRQDSSGLTAARIAGKAAVVKVEGDP